MFKFGEYVEWTVHSNYQADIQRAGVIVMVIPPGEHPNDIWYEQVVSRKLCARIEESYLIHIPKYDVVLWPSTKTMKILTQDRRDLLETQNKPATIQRLSVDRSDRYKLRKLAEEYGDRVVEHENSLAVPAWGKKFIFKTENYVEFIERVIE